MLGIWVCVEMWIELYIFLQQGMFHMNEPSVCDIQYRNMFFLCNTYVHSHLVRACIDRKKIIWPNGHGNPNLGYILHQKKDQKPNMETYVGFFGRCQLKYTAYSAQTRWIFLPLYHQLSQRRLFGFWSFLMQNV